MSEERSKHKLADGLCGFFVCFRKNATLLDRFHLQISQHELYAEDDDLVDELLYQMATEPILHVCK